jgi:Protein of unknown function (DUF4031)
VAVFVDDASIAATVGRHTSRWSHLTADSPEELHAFAARLGLRRSYYQQRPEANPGSFAAAGWHYDLTEPKRAQALRLGAVPCSARELSAVMMMRAPATLARRREKARQLVGSGGADKVCDWPGPGCGQPVWFAPTEGGSHQVLDANGADHHGTCYAWLAQEVRQRVDRRAAEAEAEAARPTLF